MTHTAIAAMLTPQPCEQPIERLYWFGEHTLSGGRVLDLYQHPETHQVFVCLTTNRGKPKWYRVPLRPTLQ